MKRLLAILLALPLAAHSAEPDFTRDIRPLLSDRCFKCHGLAEQKGKLRLDRRDDALAVLGLDDLAKSEFLLRITSDDEDEQMPPKGKAKALSAEEKAKLRAWVAAGAPYQQHWAYVKPVKAPVPAEANAVDHFVRTKLGETKLQPSPPASLETLCRRLHLDLIGLPPTPEEVEAFIQSATGNRQSAIAALVDSLLASPRFGEKWARHWLDLARYGDSAGYQHDDDMPLWLYRDWVIRAPRGRQSGLLPLAHQPRFLADPGEKVIFPELRSSDFPFQISGILLLETNSPNPNEIHHLPPALPPCCAAVRSVSLSAHLQGRPRRDLPKGRLH